MIRTTSIGISSMKYPTNFMNYLTREASQNLTGIFKIKLSELGNVGHNTENMMPNISKLIIHNELKLII